MMKKYICLLLALILALGALSSCTKSPEKPKETASETQPVKTTDDEPDEPRDAVECAVATVVMPTEKTDPEVQKIISAVIDYTSLKTISGAEVAASKDTVGSCLAAIKRAVDGGAHIIILPSARSGAALAKASVNYPDVRFISVYGTNSDTADADFKIKKNTALISLSNEVGGYLAGYAAVAEGKTRLAFLAGVSNASTNAYALGFLQGVQAAAGKLALADSSVSVTLCYSGKIDTDNNKAAELFAGNGIIPGADLILACGKSITEAAYTAAVASGKQVIGTDGDYSACGASMLTYIKTDILSEFSDILSKSDSNSEWVKFAGKQNYCMMLPNGKPAIELASLECFTVFNSAEYQTALSAAAQGLKSSINETAATGYPTVSDITSVLHLSKIDLLISAPQATVTTAPTTAATVQ